MVIRSITLEVFSNLFDRLAILWGVVRQQFYQEAWLDLGNYGARLDIGIVITNTVDGRVSCFAKPQKWVNGVVLVYLGDEAYSSISMARRRVYEQNREVMIACF